MSVKDLFEKDKTLFKSFGFDQWDRYYKALNKETPVDKVGGKPYFLKLSDNEKACYVDELNSLIEERKTFPQASYEVRLKDFN